MYCFFTVSAQLCTWRLYVYNIFTKWYGIFSRYFLSLSSHFASIHVRYFRRIFRIKWHEHKNATMTTSSPTTTTKNWINSMFSVKWKLFALSVEWQRREQICYVTPSGSGLHLRWLHHTKWAFLCYISKILNIFLTLHQHWPLRHMYCYIYMNDIIFKAMPC